MEIKYLVISYFKDMIMERNSIQKLTYIPRMGVL